MERIAMSEEERDWLDWSKRARDGKMTQREAAERMGVTERWGSKWQARMKKQGDAVVVHGPGGDEARIGSRLRARTEKQSAGGFGGGRTCTILGPTLLLEQSCESELLRSCCKGNVVGLDANLKPGTWEPGLAKRTLRRRYVVVVRAGAAGSAKSAGVGDLDDDLGWRVVGGCAIWRA